MNEDAENKPTVEWNYLTILYTKTLRLDDKNYDLFLQDLTCTHIVPV